MDSRGAAPRMARPTRRRSPDARARANASRDLVATTGSTVRLRSIRCTHTVRYGGSGGVRFIGSDPPHGSRARARARARRGRYAYGYGAVIGDGVYLLLFALWGGSCAVRDILYNRKSIIYLSFMLLVIRQRRSPMRTVPAAAPARAPIVAPAFARGPGRALPAVELGAESAAESTPSEYHVALVASRGAQDANMSGVELGAGGSENDAARAATGIVLPTTDAVVGGGSFFKTFASSARVMTPSPPESSLEKIILVAGCTLSSQTMDATADATEV